MTLHFTAQDWRRTSKCFSILAVQAVNSERQAGRVEMFGARRQTFATVVDAFKGRERI